MRGKSPYRWQARGTAALDFEAIANLGKWGERIPDDEQRRLIKLAQAGDRKAMDAVVRANLRLVISVTAQNCFDPQLTEDMVHEGTIGLMTAVRKFDVDRIDPATGRLIAFSTYACWWIRQNVIRQQPHHGACRVYVPTVLSGAVTSPNDTKTVREANPDSVEAARAALSPGSYVRLDATLEDGGTIGDALADESIDIEGAVLRRLADQEVRRLIDGLGLSERDRGIVERRIMADNPAQLAELGREYGISRERIRQIEIEITDEIAVARARERRRKVEAGAAA
jgi:RNA polymerase sigma factor (sigma-70 family)